MLGRNPDVNLHCKFTSGMGGKIYNMDRDTQRAHAAGSLYVNISTQHTLTVSWVYSRYSLMIEAMRVYEVEDAYYDNVVRTPRYVSKDK